MRLSRRAACALPALALPALAQTAAAGRAQGFPSQPVRVVLPQSTGSANDTVARVTADAFGRALGQPVVVDNRPGANGAVAINFLRQQRPDGHTLFMTGVSALSFNPHLFPNLPYDAERDFTYVSPVTDSPFLLTASRRSGITSAAQLLERARREPGRVTYSSAGIGNSTHLSVEMLADCAGIELLHVPYSGAGQAFTAVVAGEADICIMVAAVALGPVQAGLVTPLAAISRQRVPQLPNVPTQAEAGVEAPIMPGWFGLLGPAGMPEAVVSRVNAAMQAALADEATQRRLMDSLLIPYPGSPADLLTRMRQDSAVWGDFIRRRDLRPV
ncbi:MAG: tripartite tricarboxylate transporter substrate binding protein [Acetobacteraceae bacterium]|nr:tripartite tricarboxylate transporter substrate binding protein [Acetobacteraceae bacterium]